MVRTATTKQLSSCPSCPLAPASSPSTRANAAINAAPRFESSFQEGNLVTMLQVTRATSTRARRGFRCTDKSLRVQGPLGFGSAFQCLPKSAAWHNQCCKRGEARARAREKQGERVGKVHRLLQPKRPCLGEGAISGQREVQHQDFGRELCFRVKHQLHWMTLGKYSFLFAYHLTVSYH